MTHYAIHITLLLALLTSCAAPAAFSSPLDAARPDGQEVVLWHSYDGALRTALLAQIDEFNATNPWHIIIVPEYHGAPDRLTRDLQRAIDSGAAPDLTIRAPSDVWTLGDAVVPIQSYVDHARYGLTPDDMKDLYPAMLDMARDPKSDTLISFPLGGEGVVLVYNADRLAGKNYFTPPTSWPLFQEVCEQTTHDTTGDGQPDVFGFGFNPRADFATAWLNSRGGSIISDDGTHTTFSGEEGVKTLKTLQDTAKSGCFYRSRDEDVIRDFARGKVAMIFALTTQLPDIFNAVEARGGFRWGVSPVPYGRRDPTLTISGPAWVMLRSTPARQLAAWLFIRWFSDAPRTVRWSELTGLLPLRKSAAQGLANVFTLNAGFKVAFDLLSVARAQPAIPQWGSIAELLVHAVNAAVEGNDPAQVLNEAAKFADGLLNQ
jgi:ABC-type glycerol-3-phosphate transport system substrate-binding protein